MKLTEELKYTIKTHIVFNAMNVDETIEYLYKLFSEDSAKTWEEYTPQEKAKYHSLTDEEIKDLKVKVGDKRKEIMIETIKELNTDKKHITKSEEKK